MFTPHSLGIALLMMIGSALFWGSWANTYKGVKNYRFELFYWDYAIGIFLISLILALTMGSTGNDANSFLNNVHSADTANIVSTLIGGAIFALAHLLLVAAVDMGGGGGGGCGSVVRARLGGGVGLGGRVVGDAMRTGNTVGPYSIAVFLTVGALLSCSIWNVYFMKKPLVGEPVDFSGYFRGPMSGHLLGILGGVIWGTGMVFNLVAASFTGVAISYAIGHSAPIVAAVWGVLAWKEFGGACGKAKMDLGLMFVFYCFAFLLEVK